MEDKGHNTLTDINKFYTPTDNEDTLRFVRRVINEQPDSDPLRIIEVLVKVAIDELKGQPCEVFASASAQRMKITIRHSGRPIDEHMVRVMEKHTDHIDYHPDGDSGYWILNICRDIPPLFIAKR